MRTMKKFLFSLFLLSYGTFVLGAQDLVTFAGYHNQLHGYTDSRYVGSDKGDYLKTLAWYGGAEFVQNGVVTANPATKNLVLGAAGNLYVQNAFDSKTLYAVSSPVIAAQTILGDPVDRAGRFQLTLSGFTGYRDEWWAAEGGLSVFLKGYEEKSRRKYDASGNVVEAEGRGWVFDNSLILPNLRLRAGAEDLPHFVLSLFRGHYDPGYGSFQARVVIPFGPGTNLQVGGSLYETASIFVEPTFRVAGFDVGLRAGTILNYNDSAFTRVGIFEGAFLAGSVGCHW